MPKVYRKRVGKEESRRSIWTGPTQILFESLREVPWVGFAAAGTVLGGLLLFFYFNSIDHIPSDVTTLAALGSAAAFVAMGMIFLIALSLVFPAAIYRDYAEEELRLEQKRLFTFQELLLVQIGGMGVFFLVNAYRLYIDCGVVSTRAIWICLLLTIPSLYVLVRVVGHSGTPRRRVYRGYIAVSIAFLSILPSIALNAFIEAYAAPGLNHWAVLILGWLALIVANTLAAVKMEKGLLALTTFFTGLAAFSVPMVVDQPNLFPTMVATTMGVRSDGARDLLLSDESCEIVREALKKADLSGAPICQGGRWTAVRAQVLSNVGNRWLIEFHANGAESDTSANKIRITVPGSGVQLVSLMEGEPKNVKAYSCRKG